jgi:hypothetical protein
MHTKTRFTTVILAALVPILGACGDSTTGPDTVGDSGQTLGLEPELAIAVDPGLAATAVTTAEAAVGPAQTPTVRARLSLAEDHFAEARRRWAAGDHDGARTEGRLAREAIADALLEGRPTGLVDQMIEETRALVATLTADHAGYTDTGDLSSMLSALVDQAQTARDAGSDRAATERMVAARQHTDRAARDWHRDSDRRHDGLRREALARLQVAQGAHAIRLAWGLIGDAPTEAQARLMATAQELQRHAEAALAQGHLGRAAYLAHNAEIKSLVAVVVSSDRLSHDGVKSVAALSARLLEEARAVVAAGQSAVDLAILKIAARLFEHGMTQLEAGNPRGVVLLWHSATMSAVLIG